MTETVCDAENMDTEHEIADKVGKEQKEKVRVVEEKARVSSV